MLSHSADYAHAAVSLYRCVHTIRSSVRYDRLLCRRFHSAAADKHNIDGARHAAWC